jgi:hypothetical protein
MTRFAYWPVGEAEPIAFVNEKNKRIEHPLIGRIDSPKPDEERGIYTVVNSRDGVGDIPTTRSWVRAFPKAILVQSYDGWRPVSPPSPEVLSMQINSLKTGLLSAINAKRDELMNAGFSYQGNVFDCDQTAQNDMQTIKLELLSGATSPHNGFWRSKDNTFVPFDDTEIGLMFSAAKTYVHGLKSHAWLVKDGIAAMEVGVDYADDAAVIEALSAIDIEAGWPSSVFA